MKSPEKVTVYVPDSRDRLGLFETYLVMFRNIVSSRDLIWQLFKRDFFSSYRKSFLGYTWIVVSPLIGIVSWVLMNYAGILTPGETGVPYPAYVLIGSSIWGLFMGSYTSAAGTLTGGAGLVLQVNYPHEALLIKQLLHQLATFFITFVVSVIAILVFGVTPSWSILLLPLVVVPLIFFASSIGLLVSMISVIATDVTSGLQMVLGFLIYLVPVLYAEPKDAGILAQAIKYNPLTYLVCSGRDMVLYGRLYGPEGYWLAAGLSVFMFAFSLRVFYVLESRIVERL